MIFAPAQPYAKDLEIARLTNAYDDLKRRYDADIAAKDDEISRLKLALDKANEFRADTDAGC